MPISSVILDVHPGDETHVALRLADFDGIDVASAADGVVIVTTETPTMEADRELTAALRDVPGVIGANVAFCSMEDCLEETTG